MEPTIPSPTLRKTTHYHRSSTCFPSHVSAAAGLRGRDENSPGHAAQRPC